MILRRPSGPTAAALILSAVYFVVLWVTAPAVGYTRDEGYYFKAAAEYAGWWEVLFSGRFLDAFSEAEIARHFGYNTEHPPLVKLSLGWTHLLFHEGLGWAGPGQAFRAAGFLWGSLSLFATYLLGRRLAGAWVGVFAAAALATLPRYFYHAHLACFDVAITAMWTLALWSFHRAWVAPPHRVWRRSLLAGVVFGLALATKLNALFLPVVFVAFWLIAPPERPWPRRLRGPGGGPDVLLPPLPIPLVACAVVGPLVFVATWPHLWHHTFTQIGKYIGFHLSHEHYPVSYFHDLLVAPPFPVDFPFVMTGVTMPGPLILLGALGFAFAAWATVKRRSPSAALITLATLIPFVLIALPSSPIFGGVKHWLNAMPTLFIGAGAVLARAAESLRSRFPERSRWAAIALGGAVVLGPGLAGSVASHPHGIGYYNALVGGFRGGAELGMQRGYWGGLARGAFDVLETLPPGSRVFFNRTNYDSYRMYREDGLLPERMSYANEARGAAAGIVFEQPEHGEMEAEVWTHLGPRPVAGTYQDGVTLTQIYVRGRSDQAVESEEGSQPAR